MNRRTIHILCGGINSGKTMFARYLQIGKKDVYRICAEEICYSIGIEENRIMRPLLAMLLQSGDVVIDGLSNNSAINRKPLIAVAGSPDVDIYAYVIRRGIDECVDNDHNNDVIYVSQQIDFPTLREGFSKIMTVDWEDITETMMYGDEPLTAKPIIKVIERISNEMPIVVRPRKRAIKHKLERGRQNLFRPDKNV